MGMWFFPSSFSGVKHGKTKKMQIFANHLTFWMFFGMMEEMGVCLVITWNNPKKLEKPWKGLATWQSLGARFYHVARCWWWTPETTRCLGRFCLGIFRFRNFFVWGLVDGRDRHLKWFSMLLREISGFFLAATWILYSIISNKSVQKQSMEKNSK